MSEMVERVARALAKLDDDLGYDEGKWRYCVSEARAAIEAMKVPTTEMVEAGIYARDNHATLGDNMAASFVAMLDAALNPQSQP